MKKYAVLFFFFFTQSTSAQLCMPCYKAPCSNCFEQGINPRAPQTKNGQPNQTGVVCTLENDSNNDIWIVRKDKWPQKVISGKIFNVEIPIMLTDRDPDRPYLYKESINLQVPREYPVLDGFCEKYSDGGTLRFTKVRDVAILRSNELRLGKPMKRTGI